MLVSIIINNYNYGRFLRIAIESALGQTYRNVEVVVVDDGSTDCSREILAGYSGRVRTVLKENGGQASAFNAGFEKSHGSLILLLDSDDYLDERAAECVIDAWQENMSKLHFPLVAMDEQGRSLGRLFPAVGLAEGEVLEALLETGSYATPPTSGNVFSRAFLERVMPMPEGEWRDSADGYLVHLAPFFGSIGLIRSPLGNYRIHGGSITAKAANGAVRVEGLRRRLRSDLRRQALLERFSLTRGQEIGRAAVMNHYGHYKVRLASLKMAPHEHPFPQDQVLEIAAKCAYFAWRAHELRWATRAAFSVWALLIALLPKRAAKSLVAAAFSHHSGSRWREAITRPAAAYAAS